MKKTTAILKTAAEIVGIENINAFTLSNGSVYTSAMNVIAAKGERIEINHSKDGLYMGATYDYIAVSYEHVLFFVCKEWLKDIKIETGMERHKVTEAIKGDDRMRINDIVEAAHKQAIESGWWDIPKTAPEVHMLIVTEIAEATEACRTNSDDFHYDGKPEGEAVELADAVIRIADYFGHKGWDMEEVIKAKMVYNATRPYRHGNKKF